MKSFSYYFMTLVLGVILGYSWCVYHRPLVCFEIKQSISQQPFETIDLSQKIGPRIIGQVEGWVKAEMDYDKVK